MTPKDWNDLARASSLPDPFEGATRYVRDTTTAAVAAPSAADAIPWVTPSPDWWTTPAPPREWLVERREGGETAGFLPRGEVALLAAPGASGKTWLLVALAIAVMSGGAWVGPLWANARTRRVALLAGEEDEQELRARLQAQAKAAGVPLESLQGKLYLLTRSHVESMVLSGKLATNTAAPLTRFGAAVTQALQREGEASGGWDLLLLDPLTAFGAPDCETDNHAATLTMRAFEALTRLPGQPTVLVAHHTRKLGAREEVTMDSVRGASGLVNRARWVATVEPDTKGKGEAGLRWLKVQKSNYAPLGTPLLIRQGRDGTIRWEPSPEQTQAPTPAPELLPPAAPPANRLLRKPPSPGGV